VGEVAGGKELTMTTHVPMPSVGDPAPEIDAETTGGGRFVLSEHRGQWVVVFFYVRANTPG
jgi:peroxiredoxin